MRSLITIASSRTRVLPSIVYARCFPPCVLDPKLIVPPTYVFSLQSLETNTGPPTPPQGDFPLPQTVALQPQGADSSLSMRRAKRSRREREGTRGTSDGEESVTTVSRSRPGKRVRME